MKIKLFDIVNSVQAIQSLATEKLPIKISYNIQRNFRLLQPELNEYEKKRVDLINDKYGIVNPKKEGEKSVPPERMEEFINDIKELQSIEVEIDIHKIEMSDEIKISPADLLALSWMFIIDEESK